MPELPEVQTVCDVIGPQIAGRVIEDIRIYHPGVLANAQSEAFAQSLRGKVFSSMQRRGKYITFRLNSDAYLRLHLRMTGGLMVQPVHAKMEKHTHVAFLLDNGQELRFTDLRRFGRFWLFEEGEEDTISGIHTLGPEPFDAALTAEYLREHLRGKAKAIKACLLDQTLMAGIGNIYSDEILFRAGIHPAKRAGALTDGEIDKLAQLIPEVMRYYVEKNAISPEKYLQTGGREYQNTPYLQVYGHAGEGCPACGDALLKTTVAGRGSVYCARCQKA